MCTINSLGSTILVIVECLWSLTADVLCNTFEEPDYLFLLTHSLIRLWRSVTVFCNFALHHVSLYLPQCFEESAKHIFVILAAWTVHHFGPTKISQ